MFRFFLMGGGFSSLGDSRKFLVPRTPDSVVEFGREASQRTH
jgi:hypothetical protein